MNNELMIFSSCAMTKHMFLLLQICRYKWTDIKEEMINKNDSKWFSFIFVLECVYILICCYSIANTGILQQANKLC